MHNAFAVGGIEGISNFDSECQQHVGFQRTPRDAVLERDTVQELHDDERMPIVLADLVNCADVRMIQRRGSLGFALEAAQRLRVLRNIVGQEFESDKATEVGILGLVHHTHPTAPKLFDDAVMRDDLADHRAEILG